MSQLKYIYIQKEKQPLKSEI